MVMLMFLKIISGAVSHLISLKEATCHSSLNIS